MFSSTASGFPSTALGVFQARAWLSFSGFRRGTRGGPVAVFTVRPRTVTAAQGAPAPLGEPAAGGLEL